MTTAISQEIASQVGTNTAGIPGTNGGRVACAAVVNQVFQHVTGSTITGTTGQSSNLSVSETLQAIQANPDNFTPVTPEQAAASGQDYVIVSSHDIGSNGSHIGIGNSSTVWSNSSSSASVQQNYSTNSWQNHFGNTQCYLINNSAEGSSMMNHAVNTFQNGGTSVLPIAPNAYYQYASPGSNGSAFGGGAIGGTADQPLTPDQAITLNSQFFNSLGPGATAAVQPLDALQSKAQNPYSNKQFIAPISLTLNVEGVTVDIDLLTRSLITNSRNTAKQNSVLGFTRTQNAGSSISVLNPPAKKLSLTQGTTTSTNTNDLFANQHNLTKSIFDTGNAGVTQNLTNRLPNINSLITGNASIANALTTINSLPGIAGSLNGLINNPLGALTQFVGQNLPAGLPSAAGATGGALSQAFNLASSIGSSNIPESITGAVQLALQVKAIICNLKIPNITIPDIQSLLKTNFTALEKQIKQLILHELQEIVDEVINPIKKIIDEIANFFSPEHLRKLLASLIPDVNDLIKNVVNEFTKCNNGPAAKKNDLSGKDPTGTAPTATPAANSTLQINSPIANTGTGFGSSFTNSNTYVAPAGSFGSSFTNSNTYVAPAGSFGTGNTAGTVPAPATSSPVANTGSGFGSGFTGTSTSATGSFGSSGPSSSTTSSGSFGSGFNSSGTSGGSFGSPGR